MKLGVIKILVVGAEYRGSNLDEFCNMHNTNFVTTPLGKLLVALCEENTWSQDYKVSACFCYVRPYMVISHQNLEKDHNFVIEDGTAKGELTPEWTREFIRDQIDSACRRLKKQIRESQLQVERYTELKEKLR